MKVPGITLFLTSFTLVLTGCVRQFALPPIPADHPANPDAISSTPAGSTASLEPESQDHVRTESAQRPATEHGVPIGPDHVTAPEGQLFTCPMHPDVLEKKPGHCPKCGMTLVKKKTGSK